MTYERLPIIIQGGMGAGVSSWSLARAVSKAGQLRRGGELEQPLITSGDDVANVARFLKPGARSSRAVDVIEYLLRDTKATIRPAPKECAAS